MTEETPQGERLQKVLARAGVASRRHAEELIEQGRVSVDGRVVTRLGTRVPARAVIHVDGLRVKVDQTLVHLAVHKPAGVVTTMSDENGRPCVGDLLPTRTPGLFHVGRLDADSEGLLLVTNDGELGHRLAHPRYEVPKTYVVEIAGTVPRELGRRLRAGLELDDGPAAVDSFAVKEAGAGRAMIEVVVHEGRNRLVRRLFETAGHPVRRLVRTRFGDVELGQLRPGKVRPLTGGEVGRLHHSVGL